MLIQPDDCLALAIDFQERLAPVIFEHEALIKRAGILLEGLNLLKVPVIVTRQYPKGLGDTVPELRAVTGNASVFDKTSFGCYGEDEIRGAVEASNRHTILLFGVETHICVLQTLIGLRSAGYKVVLVEDCCGSRKLTDYEAGLRRAAYEGGIPATTESLLFELTQKAGGEKFKAISKLVK